jgi:dihydroorotate dehydrogenase
LYGLLRHLLFQLSPETAHDFTMSALQLMARSPLSGVLRQHIVQAARTVMGLEFPNPVGLAAGFDKDADHLYALGLLGFGFIEVGTVTPHPQPGNPRPRLFRIPQAHALINRMGFNNKGVDHLIENLRRSEFDGIVGVNIGKNKDTPNENAIDDYLTCLRKVYPHADYITVNISSPNTPGLRDLQHGDALDRLLAALKLEQRAKTDEYGRYVPITLKIAPDLSREEIARIAHAVEAEGVDGVIATNTTSGREGVTHLEIAQESGGLSGAPLTVRALNVLEELRSELAPSIPVIASGGIVSADTARARIVAGASLVQIYTGLIYRGPALVREIVESLVTDRGGELGLRRHTSS